MEPAQGDRPYFSCFSSICDLGFPTLPLCSWTIAKDGITEKRDNSLLSL